MSLLKLFSKKTPAKATLTKAAKRMEELKRVNEEPSPEELKLSENEFALTCFTVQEKTRFFNARDILELLPSMSVTAITEVVELMGRSGKPVTKQYVHQVIYPKEPSRLFASRNVNYKKIWLYLERVIEDKVRLPNQTEIAAMNSLRESPSARKDILKELKLKEADAEKIKDACDLRDAYRATVTAVSLLREGKEVLLIGANAIKLRWIKVKMRKLGVKYNLRKDDSVTPSRCLITPSEEPHADKAFSMERWISEHLPNGIRSVGLDPMMKPYASEPKAEVELFGKRYQVFHVLGTAK